MILASNCPGESAASSSFRVDYLAELTASKAVLGQGEVSSSAMVSTGFSGYRRVAPKHTYALAALAENRTPIPSGSRTISVEPN